MLVNFLLAAALITWAAPISLPLLMGAVLGGYVLRLGLIFLAVFLVRDASWFEKLPLGLTIIVTHLVLLVWELRYVSASLGLPRPQARARRAHALRRSMFALEFPPINEVIRWRDLFPTFNKIALIAVLAALITVGAAVHRVTA